MSTKCIDFAVFFFKTEPLTVILFLTEVIVNTKLTASHKA
jgi:hypothetical protein